MQLLPNSCLANMEASGTELGQQLQTPTWPLHHQDTQPRVRKETSSTDGW